MLIGVTGSIAAYRSCDIICRLRESGIDVTAVMTKEAEQFVTPLLLGYISSNPVYSDMFKAPEAWSPEHISLADRVGLVLIAPATANIIAKLANGICDDLLTCIVTATKAPVLIAPAMNTNMYTHKATQDNIKKLKSFGYKFIGPAEGRLACGTTGLGHIASTEEIVREAKKIIS
jgi:phosphopantothenoylcysteine decarboxylase/phosphopantothenate--cysteine ligase